MLRLRVLTKGTDYLAAGPPEPVLDFDSKQPRANRDGEAMFTVSVIAMSSDGTDVLKVKVPGEPKGIVRGASLKVTGLVGTYWELNGRSGVSFSAERVEPFSTRSAS